MAVGPLRSQWQGPQSAWPAGLSSTPLRQDGRGPDVVEINKAGRHFSGGGGAASPQVCPAQRQLRPL